MTAHQVLADWVGAVIAGNYQRACTEMADKSVSPVVPEAAATCASSDAKIKTMITVLTGLHTTFAPAHPTSQANVQVSGPEATGSSTNIAADKITVDGQRLDQIVLAKSTGVKQGQTDFVFGLTKINASWYVTDFNLNI